MSFFQSGEVPTWYLEGFVDAGRSSWRTIIHSLPMTVGRSRAAGLRLRSRKVSKHHAEIYFDAGLRIRDLESTNGTYVNGRRVRGARSIDAGDIIRFGDLQLRLASYQAPPSTDTKALSTADLAEFVGEQSGDFLELLRTRAVRPLFQPIIRIDDFTGFGYELLSRGSLEGFETSPTELFFIAERLERSVELSRLCREIGVEAWTELGAETRLFVNTHPSELRDVASFLKSFARVGERPRLVVEIHEAAMTDTDTMSEVRAALHELEVELAFDDFGTGQSRLQALADVAPDYVKFDLSFIRHLDGAGERRRTLIQRMIGTARQLGIEPIAEGVETAAELEACRNVGFRFAQGHQIAEPLERQAVRRFDHRLAGGLRTPSSWR